MNELGNACKLMGHRFLNVSRVQRVNFFPLFCEIMSESVKQTKEWWPIALY